MAPADDAGVALVSFANAVRSFFLVFGGGSDLCAKLDGPLQPTADRAAITPPAQTRHMLVRMAFLIREKKRLPSPILGTNLSVISGGIGFPANLVKCNPFIQRTEYRGPPLGWLLGLVSWFFQTEWLWSWLSDLQNIQRN